MARTKISSSSQLCRGQRLQDEPHAMKTSENMETWHMAHDMIAQKKNLD